MSLSWDNLALWLCLGGSVVLAYSSIMFQFYTCVPGHGCLLYAGNLSIFTSGCQDTNET